MTVVLDLGCHSHEGHPREESVFTLIGRFHPDVLYGFDPHPDLPEAVFDTDGTTVHLVRKAAWTYDGEVAYNHQDGDRQDQTVGEGGEMVPCFDLARWLEFEGEDGPVIVKMDVEGAEYVLLPHLIETGADRHVSLLLLEWHGADREAERAALIEGLRCEVQPW